MLLLCITSNFFYALLYQLYSSKNVQHFPVFPELLFWMFPGVLLVKTFFFLQIFCGHMLFTHLRCRINLSQLLQLHREALFSLIVKLGTQCNVVSVCDCSWTSILPRLIHNVFMCSNFWTALCNFRSIVCSSGSRH